MNPEDNYKYDILDNPIDDIDFDETEVAIEHEGRIPKHDWNCHVESFNARAKKPNYFIFPNITSDTECRCGAVSKK